MKTCTRPSHHLPSIPLLYTIFDYDGLALPSTPHLDAGMILMVHCREHETLEGTEGGGGSEEGEDFLEYPFHHCIEQDDMSKAQALLKVRVCALRWEKRLLKVII